MMLIYKFRSKIDEFIEKTDEFFGQTINNV